MKVNSLSVVRAQDLGLLFTENNVKMIGQDGAYSIPINSEKSLWLFGDTFIGAFDEIGRRNIERMPNNSGLICRSTDAAVGLTDFSYLTDESGKIRQLIPLTPDEAPDEYRLWGMSGCCIDQKIYWYYIRVRILPEGQWPYKFDVAGSGLVVANYPALHFSRIKENDSTILWQKEDPCFGVAVLPVKRDGFMKYCRRRSSKRTKN
jgi:hypothetical protein